MSRRSRFIKRRWHVKGNVRCPQFCCLLQVTRNHECSPSIRIMELKKQKVLSKTIRNTQLNADVKTSSSSSVSAMAKNTYNIKKHNLPSSLSPKKTKAITKSTTKMKIRPNVADRFLPLPLLALKTEAPATPRKKTISARSSTSSKNRKLSSTNNTKTVTEKQTDNQTPRSQSSRVTELPKLRTIVDNIKSLVNIDHEPIYPLLEIFVDYVDESLPDRPKQYNLNSEEFENLSEKLKEIIERFEKQKLMDPLISPGIELENDNERDYDDKFMEDKLNNLLPILRKCNGKVNFTDKNGQTILHIFIKRYVVMHQILSEEDLLKPEYKNSPQEKLRTATFRVIEALLRKKASVDIADVEGNTILHTLTKYEGCEEIMKVLLEHCTEIDKGDKNGDTLLHLMVGKKEINEKQFQNICILVFKGADVHKRNNNGKAPIHLAFEFFHFEILGVFEKKGVDFNLPTQDGKNSLHLVCISSMRDDDKKIKAIDLLASQGLDVNDVDKAGYSPMYYAVKFNDRTTIERLISLGADMFCQINEMNFTLLHLAAQSSCSSAINALIEAGMKVNVEAKFGITPLHLAVLYGGPLTVECLVVNGADVYCRDAIFGFTSIHMTAFVCGKKLGPLVKKASDVNVKNRMGITPLHLASMLGNVEVVEDLCKHGASVNCRDNLFGMTPLHWASMKGKRLNLGCIVDGKEHSEDETMINELWNACFLKTCQNCDNIDSNGSSNVRTTFKDSPSVCTIILQPNSEVMKILLKCGAHADLHDRDGRVAVYNVLKNDNVEGMRHFLEYGFDFNHFDMCRRILYTWNSVKVRSYVLWNAMKLRLAGLPLAEAYVSKVINPQFQCYDGYWEGEVKKMKKYMIDDELSLHDLLCMKVKYRAAYAQRVTALQRDLETTFPGYCSLILASCRQAVVRMDLEKLAKIKLLQVSDDYVLKACYKRVFSYLSNVDLRAFVESFEDNESVNALRTV